MFSQLIQHIMVRYVLNESKKTRRSKKARQVYFPVLYLIIAIITMLLFCVFSFFAWRSGAEMGVVIGLAVFVLLGAILLLLWCNCRIKYDNRQFVVKNIFGITHRYSYADLISGIEKKDGYQLILRDGKVNIDKSAVGAQEFIEVVRKEYFLCHNEHALTWIYK